MTVTERVKAFGILLGFDDLLFDDVADAEAFTALAAENSVLSQFPLFLSWSGDKVAVGVDKDDLDHRSNDRKLNWSTLSKYRVSGSGMVSRAK